jgi:hypothetical protein
LRTELAGGELVLSPSTGSVLRLAQDGQGGKT